MNDKNNSSGGWRRPTARVAEIAAVLLPIAFFAWLVMAKLWIKPFPSDPLQYLIPAAKDNIAVNWPWLDRIALAVNLRIFCQFVRPAYLAGALCILITNLVTMTALSLWAWRRKGFFAGIMAATLMATSYYFLAFATYIYPDQTVAMYSALAFTVLFWLGDRQKIPAWRVFVCGVFVAMAVLSKITGISALLFFSAYILWKRDWPKAAVYAAGGLAGTILVLSSFAALYGIDCLKTSLESLSGNVSTNMEGNVKCLNCVSYLSVLSSSLYIPVYAALFILAAAYRKKDSRTAMLAGWSSIAIIYFIYTASNRGGVPIPTYIFAAFPMAAAGMAIHLAPSVNIVAGKCHRDILPLRLIYIAVITTGILALMALGFHLGGRWPMVKNFNMSYHYFLPLDVYSYKIKWEYHKLIKAIFILCPIVTILLLVCHEALKKFKALPVLGLAVIVPLWCMMQNGGLARKRAEYYRKQNDFFYDNSAILSKLDAGPHCGIMVEKWRRKPKYERLLRVYNGFFSPLNPNGTKFRFIDDIGNLRYQPGMTVLTDSPNFLAEYPGSTVERKLKDGDGNELTLIKLRKLKPDKSKTITFSAAPKVADAAEPAAISSEIKIIGQSGDFSFSTVGEDGNRRLKINFTGNDTDRKARLLLAIDTPRLLAGKHLRKYDQIVFSARLEKPASGQCGVLFEQRVGREWLVDESVSGTKGVLEHKVIGAINQQANRTECAVSWSPNAAPSSIEIEHLTVDFFNTGNGENHPAASD